VGAEHDNSSSSLTHDSSSTQEYTSRTPSTITAPRFDNNANDLEQGETETDLESEYSRIVDDADDKDKDYDKDAEALKSQVNDWIIERSAEDFLIGDIGFYPTASILKDKNCKHAVRIDAGDFCVKWYPGVITKRRMVHWQRQHAGTFTDESTERVKNFDT